MRKLTLRRGRESAARLFPDSNRLLYKGVLLNLLLLYFFTGFLANFEPWVNVNNGILLLLTIYTLASLRRGASLFSPLIGLYALLTFLSVLNHWRWMPEAGLPQAARTMPIVLLAMIVCRLCAVPGLFKRSVAINALPFLLLIPIGGHFLRGRYYSEFLSENMHGHVLPLAFAVGIAAIWERRYQWKPLLCLPASLMQMFLGASRKFLFYLIPPVFMLSMTKRKLSLYHVSLIAVILAATVSVAIPTMTKRQQDRFGSDFTWKSHISAIVSGETRDASSRNRIGFIKLAFWAVRQDWLGFGNGNFPYVVRRFAGIDLPEAGHPHSGLAESLITAGYSGAALYLAMLLYLLRIGYRDPVMRICLIWLFLQIIFATTLWNRFLWPLLAIAERELQMGRIAIRTPIEERSRRAWANGSDKAVPKWRQAERAAKDTSYQDSLVGRQQSPRSRHGYC